MNLKPLIALDIGSTKVACAIGLPQSHAPGFELLGMSLVPYPTCSDAWLGDPLLVGRTIERALDATAVRGEFDRALVAISHPAVVSERVQVGITLADEPVTVRAHDVERLEMRALHQVLGVDREALLVECLACAGNGFEGVRDPRGLSATRLVGTFHVLTLPVAARRAVVQAVESAGLEVARLTYGLSAVPFSLAEERLRAQRVLLVDIGGLTADLGLLIEGALHAARVLPWGSLTLATAIAKALQVTMEQAITWSLEGTACRKPEVCALLEQHWQSLTEAVQTLLIDQPRPDIVLLSGRGALIDGCAEWLERAVGIPVTLCRSPRTSRLGEVSQQVGLGSAIGLLEGATRSTNGAAKYSPHLFDRVIERTRTILTEYF